MKINKQDTDHLNAKLSVTIEKEDYLPKFNKELASHRQKVELKGFRKGKTPMSVVKRMYGKALLIDSVNEILQKSIVDYLTEADFEIVGQPLDSGENDNINWDVSSPEDFTFTFELGIQPDFELIDMGEGVQAERTVPIIEDSIIEEELETTRKQAGIQVSVEDVIIENDMLEISGVELEDGKPKDDGLDSTFTLLVNSVSDQYKEELLKLKNGDKFNFNMSEIEKDRDETYVRKYLMKVEDEERAVNDTWEGKIVDVKRLQPAEMNKEFFEKAFGVDAGIEDEAGAKEKIKSILSDFYEGQADQLMFDKIADRLKEAHQLELPEAFLKRWLKEVNEDMSEEELEKNFPEYVSSIRWNLVKGKFAKMHALEVGEEELRNEVVQRFSRAYGQYNLPQEMMVEQLKNIMKDEQMVQSIATQVMEGKIFGKLKELYSIEDKEIELDAFKELVAPPKEPDHDHNHDHSESDDHDHHEE